LGRNVRGLGALCLGSVHGELTLALWTHSSGSTTTDGKVYGALVGRNDVKPGCLDSGSGGATL